MKRRVATIGFFDGVHLGHRYLLGEACGLSCGGEVLVLTMWPHPRIFFGKGISEGLLTTLTEKRMLLLAAGADAVEVLRFDSALAGLSSFDFMRSVLRDKYGVSILVMGYDHRFGHDGGAAEDYVRWGKELGIEVRFAAQCPGEKVSSSRIRQLLLAGDAERAGLLLGRPYSFCGEVVTGHQIGRKLGFPTANLCVQGDKLVPAGGVYAVWVNTEDGIRHRGVLNIGSRPTVGNGGGVSVEVHLLDFSGDLYGKGLEIFFVRRIRAEREFASLALLREQIGRDILVAKELAKGL